MLCWRMPKILRVLMWRDRSEGSLNQHVKIKHPDIFQKLGNISTLNYSLKESVGHSESDWVSLIHKIYYLNESIIHHQILSLYSSSFGISSFNPFLFLIDNTKAVAFSSTIGKPLINYQWSNTHWGKAFPWVFPLN